MNSQQSNFVDEDDGFNLIRIDIIKNSQELKTFAEEKNMNWPQILQPDLLDNALPGQYNVSSVPSANIIDRNGKIIANNLKGEELEKRINEVMKQ